MKKAYSAAAEAGPRRPVDSMMNGYNLRNANIYTWQHLVRSAF